MLCRRPEKSSRLNLYGSCRVRSGGDRQPSDTGAGIGSTGHAVHRGWGEIAPPSPLGAHTCCSGVDLVLSNRLAF